MSLFVESTQKGEILIGQAIGVHPAVIWPSRYYDPKKHQLLERRTRSK
ncbi:helix-turn-helix domain-containing protein [Rahnella perminowiae]|nr:helix-turn-helix domain-containing protein [Rahnella perminowiae]